MGFKNVQRNFKEFGGHSEGQYNVPRVMSTFQKILICMMVILYMFQKILIWQFIAFSIIHVWMCIIHLDVVININLFYFLSS